MKEKIHIFVINLIVWFITSIAMMFYFKFESESFIKDWIKNNQHQLENMPGDSFLVDTYAFSAVFAVILFLGNIIYHLLRKKYERK